MRRFVTLIFIGFLLLICVAFLGRNLIIKVALEQGIQALTGLPLRIDRLSLDINNTKINIEGLRLYNPPTYAERILADVPEIYVDYEASSLKQGKTVFSEIRLHLRELIVIRSEAGDLNINSIKELGKEEASPGEPVGVQIDLLDLSIGRVLYKDYAKSPPQVTVFALNLNERYRNVTGVSQLVKLIIFRALARTTISNLAGVDIREFRSGLAETLDDAKSLTSETLKKSAEIIKNTAESLSDVLKMP